MQQGKRNSRHFALLSEPHDVQAITAAESAAARARALRRATDQYVVCLTDRGSELTVMKGRLYCVVKPEVNDSPADLRVIDEEGEDYLYPRAWFEFVQLSPHAKAALASRKDAGDA
ncbi:MAG: hypothetical protein WD534_04405 [Phycisphaeraceae bacterium]